MPYEHTLVARSFSAWDRFLPKPTDHRRVYVYCDIINEDRPTTDDRPPFLEEPSWKNFKWLYFDNSAR